MSAWPEPMGQLARVLVELLRLLTTAMLDLAGRLDSLALLFAVINLATADPAGAGHWVVLVLAILLALPVATFAVLRWRWFHRLESGPTVISTEVVSPSDLAD